MVWAGFDSLKTMETKTLWQGVLKNTFWLASAEGISRILKVLLFVYMARVLGSGGYGGFTFALAFASLFAAFSDFGVSSILTRELSLKENFEKEFPSFLSLKILLGAGAMLFVVLGSFFVTSDFSIRVLIILLGVFIVSNTITEAFFAFFRARQNMKYESFTKIFQALLVTGAGATALFTFPSVQNIAIVYALASLMALAAIAPLFYAKVFAFRLVWRWETWKIILRVSWPLGMMAVFGILYPQIGPVLLGYLGQIQQVGWYDASYRIAFFALIPVLLLSQSFYPVLSRAFRDSSVSLQAVWNNQLGAAIFLAFPTAVLGVVFASPLIHFLYGSTFAPSVLLFQILIVSMSLLMMAEPFSQILIVSNQQRKNFMVNSWVAGVCILLNLIGILAFGVYGAALAFLGTALLLSLAYAGCVLRYTRVQLFHPALLSSLGAAALGSFLIYYSFIGLFDQEGLRMLSIGIAAPLLYVPLFFFFRKIMNMLLNYFSTQYAKT